MARITVKQVQKKMEKDKDIAKSTEMILYREAMKRLKILLSQFKNPKRNLAIYIANRDADAERDSSDGLTDLFYTGLKGTKNYSYLELRCEIVDLVSGFGKNRKKVFLQEFNELCDEIFTELILIEKS